MTLTPEVKSTIERQVRSLMSEHGKTKTRTILYGAVDTAVKRRKEVVTSEENISVIRKAEQTEKIAIYAAKLLDVAEG